MTENPELSQRLRQLREAFDQSFALPPEQAADDVHNLLAARIADTPYALPLREARGLFCQRRIMPVPARAPALLGLVGVRGEVVPVFSLSSLLGHGPDLEPPTWMVVCGDEDPVALAFAAFEGQLRVQAKQIHAGHNKQAQLKYVSQFAATDAGVRPIVALRAVVADVRRRQPSALSEQER